MSTALNHALLGLSVASLGASGMRVASLAAPAGLERGLAAVVLAAAAAIAQALVLGLAGLGGTPVALVAAALLTWLAVRAVLPPPERGLAEDVARWWRGLPLLERLLIGGLAGAGLAWGVWLLRHPSLGFDASIYHFAEVAAWVREGSPGSVEHVNAAFPVGSYPLSGEVLVAWAAGLSHSFVPMSLWSPGSFAVLGLSGWLGLRTLGLARPLRALALAALLSSPWIVRELAEPLTDLASLSWLAACAALCASSRRHPGLLAPAIVAAGLALGTKTTALVPLVAALAWSCYAARARLRPLLPALAAAVGLAFAAGGYWYLRNIVDHGSPSWPFVTTPWSDSAPPFVELLDVRFVERPGETLEGRGGLYADLLAGGLVALAAALVAPLLAPRREVLAAWGATALGLLAWTLAPVTGLARSPLVDPPELWPLSTTRYLLPVIAAACVTLALAARVGTRGRVFAVAALAGAAGWNLVEVAGLGAPHVPSAAVLLAGAALGAVAAFGVGFAGRLRLGRPPAAAGALACVAAGTLLATAAPGYLARHAEVTESGALDGRRLAEWFVAQPGFDGDGRRVSVVGRFVVAQLAGPRFQHHVELLPARSSCALVARRAREGWLVVARPRVARGVLGAGPVPAARCSPPGPAAYDDGQFRVYSAPR